MENLKQAFKGLGFERVLMLVVCLLLVAVLGVQIAILRQMPGNVVYVEGGTVSVDSIDNTVSVEVENTPLDVNPY